jgi:hypothetical protein
MKQIKRQRLGVLFMLVSVCFGCVPITYSRPNLPLKTVDEILRHKEALDGRDYRIAGFVRFDRISKRGFLYRNLPELRKMDYKKTIFLGLRFEDFGNLKIRDEQFVIVTGYLTEDMHGPLGAYPAHVIVDRIDAAPRRVEQ